jgi:RNA polymerase sigma factor (sigma-70 family)
MRTAAGEIKLLKKCLKGNSRAFEAIVGRYQELVCSITFSGTTDFQQSEELAHQTFINAWENLSQLRDLAKFRPWLCTIARNNIRNFMSKNQRDIIAKAEPMENMNDRATDESGPLESAIRKEHQELVSETIRQIPEGYREPLVLYYRQQKSVRRVARLLDLSEEVVKQRLQRGRKMIKEQLSSIVEETLSATRPKKAFTAAVIGTVAGMGIKASSAAAASGIAGATSTAGTATGVAAVMSGITAKVITTAAVVTIGVGAVVTYKQVTKPGPGPELSQAEKIVQEQEDFTEEVTGQPGDETANRSAIDKDRRNLESGKSPAGPTALAAGEDTIHQGIYVFDDETRDPIAGAQLRVHYGCGSNYEREQFSTDANGFYLVDFGEIKPSSLHIRVTRAGYVPMAFTWQDEMVENIGKEFSFYLPKGTKVGGIIENEDSKPIPSATVIVSMYTAEGREYPWIRMDDYTMITDANGRWQCDIFPDEPHGFSLKLSHPNYADRRIWVDEPDYKFEDFYSMKSVLIIVEGALLSGWVTDSEGTPIEGASVFTGEDRYDDVPKTTTDSEGRFEFEHFLPQLHRDTVVLTVQAKGYGPELRVVPVHREMEPVIIALGPPHTIRGRVIDVNGEPIGGAGVDADRWYGHKNLAWRGYRSISWRSETDDEGKFVWDEAPADEVDIDIYKNGYMRVAEEVFVAREEEYEIVMLPELVITGSVVDADTNEPIWNFTATPGNWWPNGGIHWGTDRYNTKDFSDGKYELIMSHPYAGHVVRIEAEGYLPAKSRVFDSDEGTVSYDFRLEKGGGPGGIVYEPNGSPAAEAEISVVRPTKNLNFENGIPSNRPQTEWAVADEDGTFSFKDLLDDSLYKLVVIHDEGFTEVTKQQWLEDPNISLQEWGRIEGRLFSGLRPIAGQVHVYNTDSHNNPNDLNYYFRIKAFTDDEGNFVIERALPGRTEVGRMIVSEDGRWRGGPILKRSK